MGAIQQQQAFVGIRLVVPKPYDFGYELSWRSHQNQRRRSAFTLLELLLVVALIVVLCAIVVPSLRGPLKTWRLRSAADQVRTAWTRCRTDAIRDGEIYVFRFVPATGRYLIAAWPDGSELPAATALEQNELDQRDRLRSPAPPATDAETNSWQPNLWLDYDVVELPEDVTVMAVEFTVKTLADPAARQGSAAQSASIPQQDLQADGLPNDGWSSPILFFPDGTSSAAVLYLASDRRQLVPITLRAMTGSARVGDVQMFDGLLR